MRTMEINVGQVTLTREDRARREGEQLERERQRQIARARVDQFEALAGRWHKAPILRHFVDAVRAETMRQYVRVEPASGLARWLDWAANHIRALDPLMAAGLPAIEG
jgi:hypothetical protein